MFKIKILKISLLVIFSLILIFFVLFYIDYKTSKHYQEVAKNEYVSTLNKEINSNNVGNKEFSEQSIKNILKDKVHSPFEIYNLHYEYDEANYVHLLKGSVKNNSENNYYRVSLNFDLLDIHGNNVDNSSWHIDNFGANEERDFSLPTYDNQITSVELNNINPVLAQ